MRVNLKLFTAATVTLCLLGFATLRYSRASQIYATYLPALMTSSVPLTSLRLAFTSTLDDNIYTMQGDGSQQIGLTNDRAANHGPVWSPDGARLAYVSGSGSNSTIGIINADGSGQAHLTSGVATNISPVWSPDGDRIAFVSTRDGNGEIYLMGADGSEQTRLTNSTAAEDCPIWSPDGTRIAFVSIRDGSSYIYLMNVDGSEQTRLTNSTAAEDCPIWSPDGTRIAFVSHSNKYSNELDVVSLDNGLTTPLFNSTSAPNLEWGIYYPEWSPDSKQILFNTVRSVFPYQIYIIYIIKADGLDEQAREITAGRQPIWSPDGAWIAYTTNTNSADRVRHIKVVNWASMQQMQLTYQNDNYEPIWAPLPDIFDLTTPLR